MPQNQMPADETDWNNDQIGEMFRDISKYYAANIIENMLYIGRIVYHDGLYSFSRDHQHDPYDMGNADNDTTQVVHVIGEVHPWTALHRIIELKVKSCLYLNENEHNNEIEVRSIHKGIGTAIYSRGQYPLIWWNPNYRDHKYFDVIDIQKVFTEKQQKDSFLSMLAESLRGYELFPPLVQLKRNN